jgi:hypothetical protein
MLAFNVTISHTKESVAISYIPLWNSILITVAYTNQQLVISVAFYATFMKPLAIITNATKNKPHLITVPKSQTTVAFEHH